MGDDVHNGDDGDEVGNDVGDDHDNGDEDDGEEGDDNGDEDGKDAHDHNDDDAAFVSYCIYVLFSVLSPPLSLTLSLSCIKRCICNRFSPTLSLIQWLCIHLCLGPWHFCVRCAVHCVHICCLFSLSSTEHVGHC